MADDEIHWVTKFDPPTLKNNVNGFNPKLKKIQIQSINLLFWHQYLKITYRRLGKTFS